MELSATKQIINDFLQLQQHKVVGKMKWKTFFNGNQEL